MKTKKCMRLLLFLGLSLSMMSCNSNDDSDPSGGPDFDKTVISGKYIGFWSWSFGTGPISMIVEETSPDNFSIKFYETGIFVPCCNSDGVTPDAIGELIMDGQNANINVILSTNSPPCSGDYLGTGIRTSSNGKFNFSMDIVHDCAPDEPATWNLTKTADL